MIPSMGGAEIGKELIEWAGNIKYGSYIVELGTWLGAGTQKLAIGANNRTEIHCYDKFEATKSEVKKAKKYNIILEEKQDTLFIVKHFLAEFKNIIYHKGDIKKIKWIEKPIGLYVDDLCKRTKKFNFAIKVFSPYWIPGETIIVLMDYYWYLRHLKEKDAQVQPEFMKKNKKCFKHIKSWRPLCCAAFLYLGGKLKI